MTRKINQKDIIIQSDLIEAVEIWNEIDHEEIKKLLA